MADSGLLCPKCNGATTVYGSKVKPGNTRRRYRECLYCGHKFTTREFIADKTIKTMKSVVYSRYCNEKVGDNNET